MYAIYLDDTHDMFLGLLVDGGPLGMLMVLFAWIWLAISPLH
jgi:hypothetical protein